VILTGVLVMYFDSGVPNLIIGTMISGIVLRGGVRILRDARDERRGADGA
jgi:hypothetical protein